MRRITAAVAAMLLIGLLPGAVSAAKPATFSDLSTSANCSATGDGTQLFFGASESSQFGTFAYVDIIAEIADDGGITPQDTGEPLYSLAEGATVDISETAIHVDGDLLEVATGETVGTVAFDISLAPDGPRTTFDDKNRFGNRWIHASGWSEPFSADATIDLPTAVGSFDDPTCDAGRNFFTETVSRPNSFVLIGTELNSFCEFSTDSSFVGLSLFDQSGKRFFAGVDTFDETGGAGGSGPIDLGGAIDVDIPLTSFETGDPAGDASLDANMVLGDSVSYVLSGATAQRRVTATSFALEGTLQVGGTTYDLDGCGGTIRQVKEIEHSPKGPKAKGAPPVNDGPSGAIAITEGRSHQQQTRTAVVAAEVELTCMVEVDENGETVVIPTEHTVWYSFVGNGGQMTVDTAGSDFDTVIEVYEADGLSPVEGACADDVSFDSPVDPQARTTQAWVTFDTDQGVRYLVQAGGFPDVQSYGRLKVSLR